MTTEETDLKTQMGQKIDSLLVPNWKQSLRWLSMQAMILDGVLLTTWGMIPDSLRQLVPPRWGTALAVAILLFGIVGRLVDQELREHQNNQ